MFFDTHFHFYGDSPAGEYLKTAHEAGTTYLMAVGADFEESKIAQKLAADDPACWFTAGAHPHQASNVVDDISMFKQFEADPNFKAVGEIGLDYFYENSVRDDQLNVFKAFLDWALAIDKPAIIHCRDMDGRDLAYEQTYELLSDFAKAGGRFVVHCFTGKCSWAERFLDLGAYLGITGIVTFPKAQNVRDVVEIIPDNRLLLETDSPYLAPVPHRGKKNHPAFLPDVATKVAEVRGCERDYIAELTTRNGFEFFKLPTE